MTDWYQEMGGDSIAVPLLGSDLKIPEYAWDEPKAQTLDGHKPKLSNKRKSVEISHDMSFADCLEPLPFLHSSYFSQTELDLGLLNELLSTKSEVDVNAGMHMTKVRRANKILSSPRRSEDWDAKPLQPKPVRTFKSFDELTKKRQKWLKSELKILWTSIAIHGNNWSLVNDILTSRSYYQIKDKGRRVLYEHGWVTGRNKKDAEVANVAAKEIAEKVMKKNNWSI